MRNYNNIAGGIFALSEPSDLALVMDIIKKYYCIADSTLVEFQRRALAQLSQQAEDAAETITHPTARRLLKTTICKYF